MSIHVENSLKDADKEIFQQRTHFVPCKIDDDGSANVNNFFEPYVMDKGEGDLTATFRGHPLDGKNMTIPEGYTGILVSETKRPLAEDADRKFQVMGGFKEFVYWNWDKKPSKNDNLVKALDWIDIAEAIHED
ncbi:ribonuclease H2 subunit C [Aricia agestis]|uniref:ribonuclease H2 subunit C n=1 Tax=Aricia agestis TaxID=91739 RepID=UPI001C201CFF|nr:ribonuclease H2 subunit C [Aricia agestis]